MENEIRALNYFLYSELLNSKTLQSPPKIAPSNKNMKVIKCPISEFDKKLSKEIEAITNDKNGLRIEIKLYGLIYPLDSDKTDSLYSFLLQKLNKEDERLEKSNIETAGYCITLSKTIQESADYLNDWEFSPEDIVISNAPWACVHFEELSPRRYKEFKDSQIIAGEIENLKESHLSIGELVMGINEIIKQNIPCDLFTDMIQAEISWSNKLNKDNSDSSDSMINSFFIKDIFATIDKFKSGNANTLLKEYLNPFSDENKRVDLRENIDFVNKSLLPNNQADGSFASQYPLRFSQAFCVNQIINNFKGKGGFYSVNGPPGTGKTTLLKDIIANIIIQRAKQISKFQEPSETLKFIGDKSKNKFVNALNPSLTGYEIVVTSSNNGAVENISKEIPKRDSIDPNMPHCSYFPEYASKLNKEDCWGLICATLGNSKNKSNFISALCVDDKVSQLNQSYAKYCYINSETNKLESFKGYLSRVRDSKVDKRSEWKRAKEDFIDTLSKIKYLADKYTKQLENEIKEIDNKLNILEKYRSSDNLQTIDSIKHIIDEIKEIAQRNPFKYDDDDEKRETSSPFMLDENGNETDLFKLKKELFVKALKLHELTILANAGKFCSNISLVEKYLGNNLDKEYKDADILEAIKSLFFIIPVISTTFASFSRLFSFTEDEFIGYLMVDEAGQAALPAALGALIRSKRAIVVGDPLQLEPVVTIPKNINSALLDYSQANPVFDLYNSSVQVRADMAQPYGTYLNIGETKIWVGSPLRVHNRCNRAMFDISNETTYDGLMIQGKKEKDVLDMPSCFIDAQDWGGTDKYYNINEEQIVKDILKKLYANYKPSSGEDESKYISIVSPFRAIVYKLKGMIKTEFPQISNKITVGTIHTMQGKESRVVIFVLGGKEEGARKWASSKPNLLNVAVTRAKERLIMVGIKSNWDNQQYFKVAINTLPIIDAKHI